MTKFDLYEHFKRLDPAVWGFGYYNRHKLSNGQECEIRFYRDEDKRYASYSVAFCVADKKRQLNAWFSGENNNVSYKCSGKCGLEALLWAKEQLKLFEKCLAHDARELEESGYHEVFEIIITGEDQKRFRVYRWALKKHGYKVVNLKSFDKGYSWALAKRIEGI